MAIRIAFIVLLLIHGFIHFLGFAKGFRLAEIDQLSIPINKQNGIFWLVAGFMFILATFAYFFAKEWWWIPATAAIVFSQILIILYWNDAKYGTILNIIILLFAIVGFAGWNFKNQFRMDVADGMNRMNNKKPGVVTAQEMEHLPDIVQKYIQSAGFGGNKEVMNVKIRFDAEMRGKTMDWFRISTEQYNFFDLNERLFFLKARLKGIPATGYHVYKDGKASMEIRLLSLIPIVKVEGQQLFEAETVTLFNDMCVFAPATLIDKNIRWHKPDKNSVKADFTNNGHTISATLHFNDQGQLINFVSDDRYDVNQEKKYRFSTPVSKYKNVNGFYLGSYGESIWHYPDGMFTYGKYNLTELQYNVVF